MTPIAYVMGPSGAGKDAVLGALRARLKADDRIAIAHRYITRSASNGGENHVALSPEEFSARRKAGLFAYHWSAHGHDYGVGVEIHAWREAGFTVVVSGSRAHFQSLRDRRLVPIVITANPAVLRERLMARGRETPAVIEERIGRNDRVSLGTPGLVTIDNSGALDGAASELEATLRVLPRETVVEALALSGFR